MFIVIIAGSIIGGIPAIIKAGGLIIMHEASHTHDKLAATSDFYEPNLTLFHGFQYLGSSYNRIGIICLISNSQNS